MFDFNGSYLLKSSFILANTCKGTAFILISYTFINLWKTKKKMVKSWIILLFALFLFFTAFSRFIDILLIYYPLYGLYIFFLSISGITALITAFVLPGVIRDRLRLLTPDEYHQLLNEAKVEMCQKEQLLIQYKNMVSNLELQVKAFEKMKDRGVWIHEQQSILEGLKHLLRNGNNDVT